MQTFDLEEAAAFLKMNAEVLRRRVASGQLPEIGGVKYGRSWVFSAKHLDDVVSGLYPNIGQSLQVIDTQQMEATKQCQSISEKKRGGFNSPRQTASEYNALLGLK